MFPVIFTLKNLHSIEKILNFAHFKAVKTEKCKGYYGLNNKNNNNKHQGLDPFDPFLLQSYSCSRQRFFGLPIVLLPCGLQWYDFKEIRFCGILCKC